MKKWLIIAGMLLFLFGGAYLVASFYAVKFVENRIQKAMGPGLTIAQIKARMTHLSIHEVRFDSPDTKQKFLQIEEIRIYPDLSGFLKRRFQIRELAVLKPSFFFYRTQEGVFIGPWILIPEEEKNVEASYKGENKGGEVNPIRINSLRIEKGAIDFNDKKAGGIPGQIRLREVEGKIENISHPFISSLSLVELKGKIEGNTKAGEIASKGWIDLMGLDMETSLKFREVDLKIFEPYYRNRVSAEIGSGYVNMDGYIAVKKSALDVAGTLEVADLQIKDMGTIFHIPAKTFRSQLRERGNRMEAQFHVKGNLEDPRFKLQEVLLMQIGFGMAKALGFPIKSALGVDKERTN